MGAPGQTKLWGPPNIMVVMEAIRDHQAQSEASEPLGMRGPEKHPLEFQWLFFSSFLVSLFKQFFTQFVGV